MKFAKVAPLRRLPNNFSILDYKIDFSVQPGSLVKIPFRRSEIFGIVLNIRGKPDIPEDKLASIKEAVWDTPLLSDTYLKLAQQISATYGAPIGPILSSMCPPLQRRKLASQELEHYCDSKYEYKRSYLWYQRQDQKKAWNEKRSSHGQTLIIVPEHRHLEQWKADLYFHSNLTQKQKFEAYFKIRNGQAQTVVGTRAAVFLPFLNLERIIVDFEHNAHHKNWDQAPRYHSAEVAQSLALSLPCQLTLASHTPSIKSARKLKNHQLMHLPPKKAVILIDQKQEYQRKNFSVLSDDLIEHIRQAKSHGKSGLIITHKRGSFSLVKCAQCGRAEQCAICLLPLIYHADTQTLDCHPCNRIYKPPELCPNCGGVAQKFHSPGSQHVASAVSALDILPIIRVDGDTDTPKPATHPHVLIGTSAALACTPWTDLAFVCIVDADGMLGIPEHRASEEFFSLAREIQYMMPARSPLLVQTREPQRAILRSLTDKPPQFWYSRELHIREKLGYPPYSSMLKLSLWEASTGMALSKLRSVAESASKLTAREKNVIVTLPYVSHPLIKRGKYGAVLLIRAENKEILADLLNQLSLPRGIKIDVDPIALLS